MSSAQGRIDSALDRINRALDESARRHEAALEAEEAQARADARERARAHAERNREIQARYADSYAAFGTETPAPVDGESPFAYRRRLFNRLQHRLGPDNDLADIRSDDLSGVVMTNFEAMLLAEGKKEGERPSFQNLPRDGSLVARNRTDEATGERSVNYYGRRSFIHDFSQGSRRVQRIVDPKRRVVLAGAPFPRAD
jgi:hypothetical protein